MASPIYVSQRVSGEGGTGGKSDTRAGLLLLLAVLMCMSSAKVRGIDGMADPTIMLGVQSAVYFI